MGTFERPPPYHLHASLTLFFASRARINKQCVIKPYELVLVMLMSIYHLWLINFIREVLIGCSYVFITVLVGY